MSRFLRRGKNVVREKRRTMPKKGMKSILNVTPWTGYKWTTTYYARFIHLGSTF